MRIVFYIGGLGVGGAERVVLNLAEAMHQQGLDVRLVIDRKTMQMLPVPSQIPLHVLGAERTVLALPKLVRCLGRLKPDVVVSALIYNNFNAILAKFFARFFLIVTEHNPFSMEKKSGALSRKIAPLLMRLLYPHANARVGVSHAVANDFKRYTSAPFTVIHNPILPDNWQALYQQPIPEAVLGTLPRPLFLGVGRLTPQKNWPLLLDAFALYRQQHGVGHLLVLGEGELRPQLLAHAQHLGIAQHISMPGAVNPVYPCYALADVFVLPSLFEGFGNVVVEAMAAGLPVVSTKSGGVEDILGDNQYGLLTDFTPSAMAEAMHRVLQEKAHWQQQSRTRAVDFTVAKITAQYLKLINQ